MELHLQQEEEVLQALLDMGGLREDLVEVEVEVVEVELVLLVKVMQVLED
jgi:hypothetical protein